MLNSIITKGNRVINEIVDIYTLILALIRAHKVWTFTAIVGAIIAPYLFNAIYYTAGAIYYTLVAVAILAGILLAAVVLWLILVIAVYVIGLNTSKYLAVYFAVFFVINLFYFYKLMDFLTLTGDDFAATCSVSEGEFGAIVMASGARAIWDVMFVIGGNRLINKYALEMMMVLLIVIHLYGPDPFTDTTPYSQIKEDGAIPVYVRTLTAQIIPYIDEHIRPYMADHFKPYADMRDMLAACTAPTGK